MTERPQTNVFYYGIIAIEPIYWSGLHIKVDADQPVPEATRPAFAC